MGDNRSWCEFLKISEFAFQCDLADLEHCSLVAVSNKFGYVLVGVGTTLHYIPVHALVEFLRTGSGPGTLSHELWFPISFVRLDPSELSFAVAGSFEVVIQSLKSTKSRTHFVVESPIVDIHWKSTLLGVLTMDNTVSIYSGDKLCRRLPRIAAMSSDLNVFACSESLRLKFSHGGYEHSYNLGHFRVAAVNKDSSRAVVLYGQNRSNPAIRVYSMNPQFTLALEKALPMGETVGPCSGFIEWSSSHDVCFVAATNQSTVEVVFRGISSWKSQTGHGIASDSRMRGLGLVPSVSLASAQVTVGGRTFDRSPVYLLLLSSCGTLSLYAFVDFRPQDGSSPAMQMPAQLSVRSLGPLVKPVSAFLTNQLLKHGRTDYAKRQIREIGKTLEQLKQICEAFSGQNEKFIVSNKRTLRNLNVLIGPYHSHLQSNQHWAQHHKEISHALNDLQVIVQLKADCKATTLQRKAQEIALNCLRVRAKAQGLAQVSEMYQEAKESVQPFRSVAKPFPAPPPYTPEELVEERFERLERLISEAEANVSAARKRAGRTQAKRFSFEAVEEEEEEAEPNNYEDIEEIRLRFANVCRHYKLYVEVNERWVPQEAGCLPLYEQETLELPEDSQPRYVRVAPPTAAFCGYPSDQAQSSSAPKAASTLPGSAGVFSQGFGGIFGQSGNPVKTTPEAYKAFDTSPGTARLLNQGFEGFFGQSGNPVKTTPEIQKPLQQPLSKPSKPIDVGHNPLSQVTLYDPSK